MNSQSLEAIWRRERTKIANWAKWIRKAYEAGVGETSLGVEEA